MHIDPLQSLIEKNRYKIESCGRPPKTPHVRDLYELSALYSNTNQKSHSIDRSFVSMVPSRKTTFQNSFQPPQYSRLIEQSSPLSSIKGSLFCEQQSFQSPKRTSGQDEVLKKEIRELRDKLDTKERYIDSILRGSQLQEMQREIAQLRKEKEILQSQHQLSIKQLSREIEICKRNASNVEKAMQEQISAQEVELAKYKECGKRIEEIELSMQSIVVENAQLKQQKVEEHKFYKEIQEQFETFYGRTVECRTRLQDTKHYGFQLGQITQFLLNRQSPPLEFLVQMNKLQKQLKKEQDQQTLPQGCSLKMLLAQVLTIQVENQVLLNQMFKEMKNLVDKYTQQYVSEVGMQMVSVS